MNLKADPKTEFGRLLLYQSGATVFRSVVWLLAALLCWGLALFILLTHLRGEISYLFPLVLILVGICSLLAIPLGRIKSIECYEGGVIIKNGLKTRMAFHSDIVAVQFLAVMKYNQGIYEGTICHLEIIPYVESTVKIRIWGSRNDSHRIWNIVQIILRANPDAKLLDLN